MRLRDIDQLAVCRVDENCVLFLSHSHFKPRTLHQFGQGSEIRIGGRRSDGCEKFLKVRHAEFRLS